MTYTLTEQMIVVASRLLRDGDTLYTGVGLPTMAAFLAKLTHAPRLTIVFETGIVRTTPCQLPQGVDTLASQEFADKLADVFYINTLAERGLINLGFLGAGQIDRHGNINSTAVGPYRTPAFRFPGGGGACDIACLTKWVAILRQKRVRFPAKSDFVTGPGYLDGTPGARERAGLPAGTGPTKVITDLGVFGFVNGDMTLESIHAGVTIAQVRDNTGWPLSMSPEIAATAAPTRDELEVLRRCVLRGGGGSEAAA